jgi:NTP pyrophosphatase (non-canonical NTP hydrolase)
MIRREVLRFTDAMESVLKKNDYKGGWNECNVSYLRARLVEELGEYFARVAINIDYEATKPLDARDKELERKELVDIANFAMMLWDRS